MSATPESNEDTRGKKVEEVPMEIKKPVVPMGRSLPKASRPSLPEQPQEYPLLGLNENTSLPPKDHFPEGVVPLLLELIDDTLGRLPMLEVLQLRHQLGKDFRDSTRGPGAFSRKRPDAEGEFSPTFFMTDDNGGLLWYGFDTKLRNWARLPSLNFAKAILPSPDPDLSQQYLVAGDGGLLCINVGKAKGREKLVLCNPLTQQVKVLPRLKYARHPVLMHLKVDVDSGHYTVIVAGSAAADSSEAATLKTEVYNSSSGLWECPEGSDLPCPPFGLNEYQNGVYFKDSDSESKLLLCVAVVEPCKRGVLVYDYTKKKWVRGPHIPLLHGSQLASSQMVECGGSVFVFSEQEVSWDEVYLVIHELIGTSESSEGQFIWSEIARRRSQPGSKLKFPGGFVCVPVSERELGIFNTVELTMEIIDLNRPQEIATLIEAPESKGTRFYTNNPISFVFKPSFKSVVCPRGHNYEMLCDAMPTEYCSGCEREKQFSVTENHGRSKAINLPSHEEGGGLSEHSDTALNPGNSPSPEEFFRCLDNRFALYQEVIDYVNHE